jgi:hypothetical protein
VRIQFRGLPKGIAVTLLTQRGKPLADAEAVGDEKQQVSALTFRPSPSQDFVLVFHRAKSGKATTPIPVGIEVQWGAGKAPPPATQAEAGKPKRRAEPPRAKPSKAKPSKSARR